MKAVMLYFVLLKATMTTFAGLASLPVLREDLVVKQHILTDVQLSTAIVVTRTTPGPVGLYVVSVGYLVDGIRGAIAGWLAMATPALVIIPLIYYARLRVEHPRTQGMIQMVVLASAGLLWYAAVPLARSAVTSRFDVFLLLACLSILLTRKIGSFWVIVGAALVSLAGSLPLF